MKQIGYNKAIKALKEIMSYIITHKGIEYTTVSIGPNTYGDMVFYREEFGKFLISLEGNDSSIYGSESNIHFRAWHDYIHYTYGLTFSKANEIKTAMIQIDQARIYGETLGYSNTILDNIEKILKADIIGQVLYWYENREFVDNQEAFVKDLLGVA